MGIEAMEEQNNQFFKSFSVLGLSQETDLALLYRQLFEKTMNKLFYGRALSLENFSSLLPYFAYSELKGDSLPFTISFFLVCSHGLNAFKFFFEMLSHWLVPGKKLNATLINCLDFELPGKRGEVYSLSEIMIRVENKEELLEMQQNLSIFESEIRLGITSSYFASKILEVKGLSADEKTALVQEHIASLVRRLPRYFGNDVFAEMQHLMVTSLDAFKEAREFRHLSKIITAHYLFRTALQAEIRRNPATRHVKVKVFRASVRKGEVFTHALGVAVGLNFLDTREVFEERHLLKAIQSSLPNVKSLPGSFFMSQREGKQVLALYMEIEKVSGYEFTGEEIESLRASLSGNLKDSIGLLMPPVFMPRNEEEIMRNILVLSQQLKYVTDIPQVVISFDEQTKKRLNFTVILLRVLKGEEPSIQDLFLASETSMKYHHDRLKVVGYLRKKYPKEATVFRVGVPTEAFLRQDYSIDLYKARQFVVTELGSIVGEIRDFNGGMITKQNELLTAVREQLVDTGRFNELLLENFFYSLTPVVMRNVLEPSAFKELFLMLLRALEKRSFGGRKTHLEVVESRSYLYLLISSESLEIREELLPLVTKFNLSTSELASAYVNVYGRANFGFIIRSDNMEKRQGIQKRLEKFLQKWEESLLAQTA